MKSEYHNNKEFAIFFPGRLFHTRAVILESFGQSSRHDYVATRLEKFPTCRHPRYCEMHGLCDTYPSP